MRKIMLFESFIEQEINKATDEEQRIKNRVPMKNDKIKMGTYVYMDAKSYRCIESDGEGNTRIQEVKNGDEDLGEIITLTDEQVNKAEPVDVTDSDGVAYAWKIK